MKKGLLFVFICFLALTISAQDYNKTYTIHTSDPLKMSPLERMEDSLVYMADSMLASQIPEARIGAGYSFIKGMKRLLETSGSYKFPLKKLNEKIYILNAPDNRFRIFTWEILLSNTEVRYYGVIQMEDGAYQPLVDVSDQIIRGAEDSVFTNMRWFGAVYYHIEQKKIGNTDAYFLIGYNGNEINGDKKIVDVFGFDDKNRGVFGAPLFTVLDNNRRKKTNRFILNYQKNSKVSLNYDKEKGMIIFDHCESSVGDAAKKSTNVPDGTYDGLKWEGNSWNMYNNVVEILELPQNSAPIEKPIKE